MKRICLFLLVPSVLVFSSWGFLVHRTTAQLAIYNLPKPMRSFFHENLSYLVKNAPRPDQRRNDDSTEAPKHFIDLEAFGDSAAWKMPLRWEDAVRIYTKDTMIKYGYVPYWVIEMKNRLTNAFKSKNKDSILFYAADISHYIADANVPLHTSINHDGQLTNQKGLHSLWESMIPEIELTNYQLYSGHKASYVRHPEEAIWNAVREAHMLLPQLFNEEKNVSRNFTDSTKFRVQMRNGRESKSYTSNFAKSYSKALGNTINAQLLKSSDMIADFWYTCWVDSGKPNLKKLLKTSNHSQKKQWKKEFRSLKKNRIISDSLLIARTSGTN